MLLPSTKDLMKDKIMHFNQQVHTPAVVHLLNNLIQPPKKKRPRHKNLLLPKLKDSSFQYKSLNNSRVSSINNSVDSTIVNDMSTINDDLQQIRLKDIASKSVLSPKSSEQLLFLQGVESEPKRYFATKLRSSETRSKRAMSVQPKIEIQNELRRSPSIIQDINEVENSNYTFQQLADYNAIRLSASKPSLVALADYFEFQQPNIIKAIRKKDTEKMIDVFRRVLELCQQHNLLNVFSESLLYLGGFCLDCEQIDKAAFLLQQTLILAEHTKNYHLKMNVLQQLSVCATKLKKNQVAIDLLKKSLVYAWHINDFEKEILAYDMIGLNFFYCGDIAQAIKFHEKYILAEVEPLGGYFRRTSEKFIGFYEQTLVHYTKELNNALMLNLALPIRNMLQPTEDNEYLNCDHFRQIRYNNCDASKILDELVTSIEFKQYYLDYYSMGPRLHKIKSNLREEKFERLPRRIVEIKLKYSNHREHYQFSHKIPLGDKFERKKSSDENIEFNPLYKIPLEDRIKARVENKFDLEKVLNHAIRNRGWDPPSGQMQGQIYIKHLKEVRPSKEVWTQFLRRNKEKIGALLSGLK